MSKSRQRNRSHSARDKSTTGSHSSAENWLWGQHAVEAALVNSKRQIKRLLATQNAFSRMPSLKGRAEVVDAQTLDHTLPRGAVHQGVAAEVFPLAGTALEELIHADIKRLVVLDQVSDPHNLGAVFRSAAAFGFGGVILQTRNAPAITGVVAKAAAGAIETVAECRVVNISRALDLLGEAGFHTVGLAGGGRASLEQAVSGAQKLAIVLGAEGPGLRAGVAKACAELAHIQIEQDMESLNVSNAAAIAFYEAARSMAR